MDQIEQFLVLMVALSTAAQTLTEYVVKSIFEQQLGSTLPDPSKERRRQVWLHAFSVLFGAAIDWSMKLRPISDLLGRTHSNIAGNTPWVEGLVVGILVSFGSGFFNDLLGALNAFKSAQASVSLAAASAPPPAIVGGAAEPIAPVPAAAGPG